MIVAGLFLGSLYVLLMVAVPVLVYRSLKTRKSNARALAVRQATPLRALPSSPQMQLRAPRAPALAPNQAYAIVERSGDTVTIRPVRDA